MTDPAIVSNPFGKSVSVAAGNAMATAESERAIQEVQAAMVIAKKFPRNPMEAMDRIINACTRVSLANSALYCYPRGGQEVTGPSIRLAEAMAQEWGNIQYGIRELSAENGMSTVEAFAWDMQTNTRQVKVFQVPHKRYSKNKVTTLTDPRDVYELIANQGARRMRACILGVIPGDVTESAVNQCEVTQQSAVEVTPATIKAMVDAFTKHYGVTQEMIEKKLGKRAEAINAPQLLHLRKVYQSLKDGISKPSAWFDVTPVEDAEEPKVSDLSVKKPASKKAPAEKTKPAPEVDAPEKSDGDGEGDDGEPDDENHSDDARGIFGGE